MVSSETEDPSEGKDAGTETSVAEDEQHLDEENEDGLPNDGLSKKARKRLLRSQKFHETRLQKRMEEKARKKEKRKALKEAGDGALLKKAKKFSMKDSNCKWEELMGEKDKKSAISQIAFAYAQNRRVSNPLQYHLVGFSGEIRKMFDSNPTNLNWDVLITEKSLEEMYKKEEIVYLAAESDNVLMDLDDSKVYVIGGLVDHNGHCFNWAVETGFAHARLPIGEYVKLASRKVLAINHVFEILLRYSENHNWEKAFFRRKGVEKKENKDNDKDEGGGVTENSTRNLADEKPEESRVKVEPFVDLLKEEATS